MLKRKLINSKKAQKSRFRIKKQAKQQPKPQKHGEKQKIGTAMSMTVETTTESNRRTVDTRGSYVNLDKYNERYEQIAQ